MGAPQQQAKVLRIGIIQAGKITEERLISRGESVTIGEAADNTFVLPQSALPRSFPLFVANGQGYNLNFNEQIQGKVSVGGNVLELETLRARKETKREKDWYVFPLNSEMRGKVTFNDISILFQFVPPPVAPIGGVGGELYLSWRSRVDWLMTGILAISLVLHFSFVFYTKSLAPPPEPAFTEIPERFVKLLKQPAPPEPEPEPEGPSEEEKAKDDGSKQPDPSEKADDKTKEKKPLTEEEKKAAARDKVASKGLLAVIGAKGLNTTGPRVADIMDAGPGGDLDQFLKSDASLAKAGTAGLRTGEYGHAPVDDIGGPEIAARDVNVDQRKSSGPKSKMDAPQDVIGSLDSKKIQSALAKYRPALDKCHTRALNLDPNVSGRVVVSVTLEPSGKVVDVAVIENTTGSTELEKCLILRMQKWQFPAYEGDVAQFNLPFVFTASG